MSEDVPAYWAGVWFMPKRRESAKSKHFNDLTSNDKAVLLDALLSMLLMSDRIQNEHGFLVYRTGDLTFDIDTPERIVAVANFLSNTPEWNNSIDPPKSLRWSRTIYSKSV